MFKFFLCNLTDTSSFVAERIYEYHTNILLVVLIVMVIVMGGLYFTGLFVVRNITYNIYNQNVIFKIDTLITLNEKVISSIFLKTNLVQKNNLIQTELNKIFNKKIRFILQSLGIR